MKLKIPWIAAFAVVLLVALALPGSAATNQMTSAVVLSQSAQMAKSASAQSVTAEMVVAQPSELNLEWWAITRTASRNQFVVSQSVVTEAHFKSCLTTQSAVNHSLVAEVVWSAVNPPEIIWSLSSARVAYRSMAEVNVLKMPLLAIQDVFASPIITKTSFESAIEATPMATETQAMSTMSGTLTELKSATQRHSADPPQDLLGQIIEIRVPRTEGAIQRFSGAAPLYAFAWYTSASFTDITDVI